ALASCRGLRLAGGAGAVPTRGENRARPPALLRKPTTNVRLSPSSYTRSPPTRTSGAIEADCRGTGRVGRRDQAQAVAQIRPRRCLPLHARPLDLANPLLRRRPARARQQSGRARAALRRNRPQKLLFAGSDAGGRRAAEM